jgi:hypothetical protein
MTVTAARQFNTKNTIVYLFTHDGGAGDAATIPNDAGASPDLTTDAEGGLLKAIMTARTNGYGAFAAGALNQAQARALLFSMDPSNVFGTDNIARARCATLTMTGVDDWVLDANVDGQGDPVLTATKTTTAAGTFLVTIQALPSPDY